jgi:hypothetical protein
VTKYFFPNDWPWDSYGVSTGNGQTIYTVNIDVAAAALGSGVTERNRSVSYPQDYLYIQHLNLPTTFSTVGSITSNPYDFGNNWYGAMLGGLGSQAGSLTSNWQSVMSGGLASLGSLGQQPETTEERAARIVRQAEQEAKRKAASLRAEHLLFTILTPSQVKQYTDDACFDVEVDGRVYRLHSNSRSGNVVLLENGKPKFKYCAHPRDAHDVPIPDVLLGQLLMLQTNEPEFLRLANRTVLQ